MNNAGCLDICVKEVFCMRSIPLENEGLEGWESVCGRLDNYIWNGLVAHLAFALILMQNMFCLKSRSSARILIYSNKGVLWDTNSSKRS